ncbi:MULTISPECIES: DUF2514 family protein [unclassified Pseudomonas]|uniref:DUF2514 family protein n=1 Tax=unclassified Pseudomonas TaxID=196821 RepID=UPI00146439B1|nr:MULTISPECIES: DUF2514 family protein [unclassified Pseudomonas]QJI20325.1 DUF2514 domain-containing protein [Pseudomonas sp. ADAK21]QJI24521.1 DUF2514 domain-containing protein [Pseudomonas sp. ADAK20]
MKPIWLRILPFIAAVAIVLIGLFMAYGHGQSVTDAKWQAKWSDRDANDAAATALNESIERAKEQSRQQTINKVIQDGQKVIDQAYADAAASRDDRSLRDAADATAGRFAASQVGGHSCTAAASQAATRAVMVFADVLKRADQRAAELASTADQSRARGVTCERAYDGLGD